MININVFNNKLYRKIRLKKIKSVVRPIKFDKIIKPINNNDDSKSINANISNIKVYLDKFYSTLLDEIGIENLNNYYRNIETLKVFTSKNPIRKLFSTKGEYNIYKNKLYIYSDLDETIMHELLHLASTNIKNKKGHCGFYQLNDNDSIGYGLNEGYTAYLDGILFNTNNEDVYEEEIIIVKYLSKIITEEKMKEYYFNGNLYELINDLTKYANKIAIMNFLARLDYTVILSGKAKSDTEAKFANNMYNSLLQFLININKNKINMCSNLPNSEKSKKINEFNDSLINEFNELVIKYNKTKTR